MTVELAHENYLRPNGHGGYIVRQSDLSAWSRCNLQKFYYDRAKANPAAAQPQALSATVYGTVMHYCLQLLEQMHHDKRTDAIDVAVATFRHYWHPANIEGVAEKVTTWLPRQTYQGLLERGVHILTDYGDILTRDTGRLLALEYGFAVPIVLDGVTHTLTGTVDRLAIRKHYTKPYLALEDFKSGKQQRYLRYNMQGTAYSFATTQREFWLGWPESGVEQHFTPFPDETFDALVAMFDSWSFAVLDEPGRQHPLAGRKFRWLNMSDLKVGDGGWRSERDFSRLHLAIDGYLRQNLAGAYAVTTTGETCFFCPFNKTCGGTGIPDEMEGRP